MDKIYFTVSRALLRIVIFVSNVLKLLTKLIYLYIYTLDPNHQRCTRSCDLLLRSGYNFFSFWLLHTSKTIDYAIDCAAFFTLMKTRKWKRNKRRRGSLTPNFCGGLGPLPVSPCASNSIWPSGRATGNPGCTTPWGWWSSPASLKQQDRDAVITFPVSERVFPRDSHPSDKRIWWWTFCSDGPRPSAAPDRSDSRPSPFADNQRRVLENPTRTYLEQTPAGNYYRNQILLS